MKGDQETARYCYTDYVRRKDVATLDPREPRMEEVEEEVEKIQVRKRESDKRVKVGKSTKPEVKEGLVKLLREYNDVFAWTHEEMPGIHPAISLHRLSVDPDAKPMKQKRRTFNKERQEAIEQEVDRLLEANLIKEA